MAKQAATTSNKRELPIDMTYGFPGKLPRAAKGNDTKKLLKFFELYAGGVSAREAGRRVGFSEKWSKQYSYQWLKRHADYVTWLQAHVAQASAVHLAIDQSDVLDTIARIALANDFDYLVFEHKRGKVVARAKELHELTREQMAAVEAVRDQNGKLRGGYRFRDRDGKLFELGKHLGMFNEKVILEHRHRHLHLSADLSKVPMAQLEALEAAYEAALLTHEEPDAERPVSPVRGHQGQNGGGGQATGGSEDLGGQDHQQQGRRRASKSP